MESRELLRLTPCELPSRRWEIVSVYARTTSDAELESRATAVRVVRDTAQRRANANVATVSVAAALTLMRSRRAFARSTATVISTPTTVTTTMSSGSVVPRRIDPFR
jgi:hypothetical protein